MKVAAALLIVVGAAYAVHPPVVSADGAAPAVGRAAPTFRLVGTDRKPHSLAEFKGRRVALFFFCGCTWCADVAREWASLQRGGALAESAPGGSTRDGAARAAADGPPVTILIGSGLDAEGCQGLASRAGLDLTQTVLLPDPDASVVRVYNADPCPRVFVIDAGGILRYTNNGKDDTPRKAPALAIVSHALDALRLPALPRGPGDSTPKSDPRR